MKSSPRSCAGWVARLSALLLLVGLAPGVMAQAARPHGEPELRAIIQQAIAGADCLSERFDRFDWEVWFSLMEPRLRNIVKDADERLRILEATFCEAHRPDEIRLPPGLIMAVMDVESRFDRWAVSSAGAVGLMQIMPFWPRELGMERHQLVQVEENIRMGCAILRHYLQREKNDVRKALARYNGSVGRRKYPDLVVTRWTSRWSGADDLGVATVKR